MPNQSFNYDNFYNIYELENRKGGLFQNRILDKAFTKEISAIQHKISHHKKQYKKLIKIKNIPQHNVPRLDLTINNKKDHIKNLIKEKDDIIYKYLTNAVDKGLENKFYITIAKTMNNIYEVKNETYSYFVLKQLQYNIKKIFKVKPSNRNSIIEFLSNVLVDNSKKFFLRTDITSFYESIDHEILISMLNDNYLLSTASLAIIKDILEQYSRLNDNTRCGLPRGLGISAYLSEIYMRSFDTKYKTYEGVFYYARYVDDIIIIASRPNIIDEIKSDILLFLTEKLKLNLNNDKTVICPADKTHKFDYLGYHFNIHKQKLSLTKSKFLKYKNKITVSFVAYEKSKIRNSKKASKLLFRRIKFLTGNIRLSANLSNVMQGIHFSNRYISDINSLKGLDKFLKHNINKYTQNSSYLKCKLMKCSFAEGFSQVRFHRFTLSEISEITKLWKYEK